VKPQDPVSENMSVLRGEPIKAFMYQDHEAHIATHMAFAQDPKLQQIMQNDPAAQAKMAAGAAHISEHVAFAYRAEIEKQLGVALPPPDEKLPEDVEVDLSRLTAQAAQRLLQKNQVEAQQQQMQQQMQDPVVQAQMEEVQIKRGELDRKARKDQMDFEIDQQRLLIERERIASTEKTQAATRNIKMFSDADKTTLAKQKLEDAKSIEGFRAGVASVKQSKPTPEE